MNSDMVIVVGILFLTGLVTAYFTYRLTRAATDLNKRIERTEADMDEFIRASLRRLCGNIIHAAMVLLREAAASLKTNGDAPLVVEGNSFTAQLRQLQKSIQKFEPDRNVIDTAENTIAILSRISPWLQKHIISRTAAGSGSKSSVVIDEVMKAAQKLSDDVEQVLLNGAENRAKLDLIAALAVEGHRSMYIIMNLAFPKTCP